MRIELCVLIGLVVSIQNRELRHVIITHLGCQFALLAVKKQHEQQRTIPCSSELSAT